MTMLEYALTRWPREAGRLQELISRPQLSVEEECEKNRLNDIVGARLLKDARRGRISLTGIPSHGGPREEIPTGYEH